MAEQSQNVQTKVTALPRSRCRLWKQIGRRSNEMKTPPAQREAAVWRSCRKIGQCLSGASSMHPGNAGDLLPAFIGLVGAGDDLRTAHAGRAPLLPEPGSRAECLHGGRWSTTSGSKRAIRTASWQWLPSKCVHFFSSQRADSRNTCETSRGAASSSVPGVAGTASLR